jgi:hypothetical protein
LGSKWRSLPEFRGYGHVRVRLRIRQSSGPVCRRYPEPDIFRVTAHRPFDGQSPQSRVELLRLRQIALKMLTATRPGATFTRWRAVGLRGGGRIWSSKTCGAPVDDPGSALPAARVADAPTAYDKALAETPRS